MPNDPFTTIYQQLRSIIYARWSGLSLIKPANFQDMSATTFTRFMLQRQPSQLPAAYLLQHNFTLKPFGGNSKVFGGSQNLQLVTTHDMLQVTPVNVLKFQTGVALRQSGIDLGLPGLVDDWNITGGVDNPLGNEEWAPGVERPVSIMAINVSFYIPDDSTLLV